MQFPKLFFAFLILLFSHTVFAQGHSNGGSSSGALSCESTDPSVEVDMACIEEQLKTTGLGGWVHATVMDQTLLVFTWRRPGNFFVNIQLPMASKDYSIMQQLMNLRRHDQIEIKGEFFKSDAPIQHINVTSLKVVKAYDGPLEKYEYDPQLPAEIMAGTKFTGKVHIVANGGSVLVVETGDRVFPVVNPKPELAAHLFRNDKIELDYTVQFLPMRPAHLVVDIDQSNPIRVIERIEDGHGSEIVLEGPLVMFPESPQIKFNVFALRQDAGDGVNRNWTIVNFSDIDLFLALRDKLQKVWDDHLASSQYDRNKYINRKIMLKVKGTKNVVAPNQANPQVVPSKIEDVEITIL